MAVEPDDRAVAAVERICLRVGCIGHRMGIVVAGRIGIHLGRGFGEQHRRRKQLRTGRLVAAQIIPVETVGDPAAVEPFGYIRVVQVDPVFRAPPEILLGFAVDGVGARQLMPERIGAVVVIQRAAVVVHIHLSCQPDLLGVADAFGLISRTARFLQSRKQHRSQNRDDRNHDEKLD